MSETDNNTQAEKPKTSKLAIASLFAPIIMWCIGFCGTLCGWLFWKSFYQNSPEAIKLLCSSGPLIAFLVGPVGITLGLLALSKIKHSNGILKGKRFAIEGILLSLLLEVVYYWFCIYARTYTSAG